MYVCVSVSIACIRAVFVENCLNFRYLYDHTFIWKAGMGHGVPSWSNIIHTFENEKVAGVKANLELFDETISNFQLLS